MTRKEALLPFFKLLFNDRKQLLKALLRFTREADKRHYFHKRYKEIAAVEITDIVGSIDEQISSYTYLDGTSRTIDLVFIKLLCRKYPNCNYLEIGSLRGESLVNAAQVASKCTSISLSGEEMLSIGMNKEDVDLQGLFSQELPNVRHIEANSLTFDFNSLEEKYDVIFVDGDHSYKGVKSDTENAFRLLKDENSVIVWHDCGFGMEDLRYETLTAVLDGCPVDKRDKIYRVSNTMCGIFSNAPLPPLKLQSLHQPTKVFNLHIQSLPYQVK